MRIISVATLAIFVSMLSDGLTVPTADACGVKLTVKSQRRRHRQVGAKGASEPIAAANTSRKEPKAAGGSGKTVIAAGGDQADVGPKATGGSDSARTVAVGTKPPRVDRKPAPVRQPDPEPAPTPVASVEADPTPAPTESPRKSRREPRPDREPSPSRDDSPAIDVTVYFGSNSTAVDETADSGLQEAVEWLSSNPRGSLVVIGHADAAGPDGFNLKLSRRRAASVKRHLIDKANVAGKRIRVVGRGESQLADPNDDSKNRRVEIRKR